jgi:cytochrome c oxidase accessory protein FixG
VAQDNTNNSTQQSLDDLYEEQDHWHINTGDETTHAKRIPGFFRTLKWLGASVWLIFFLGPYLRYGDRQAVLFDIPGRQFHIFNITILPQDVWMLSLVLLFFAILLAAITSIAGRVFCGYFCFQTVWTDLFTLIEEKLEGNPSQRRKMDKAPLTLKKFSIKFVKHTIWLFIGFLTGISFVLWFADAYEVWAGFFAFDLSTVAWGIIVAFTLGTYTFGGHMREQVCFWLCPYARFQGVMYDPDTLLPTYDYHRGEPRGKLKKGQPIEGNGDCISCNQCLAVCPTGVDIRDGQQEGCITCGLCIDACDAIMDKIGKPRGLVKYLTLDELLGKPVVPLFKRTRVLVYIAIILAAIGGIVYGLTHLGSIELKVLHERQPLFVMQSDGTIQNKYYLKVLNKTDKEMHLAITAKGPEGLELIHERDEYVARKGHLSAYNVFVKVPDDLRKEEVENIFFTVVSKDDPTITTEYKSMFIGPKK